ncbi:MAG: hypothetical protein RI910_776 [Verrucomicrobiota bacterium]
MNERSKKKCRCCHKSKSLDLFHRLEGTAAIHPFCRPCLDVAARRRSALRGVRRTNTTRACAQCDQERATTATAVRAMPLTWRNVTAACKANGDVLEKFSRWWLDRDLNPEPID